MVWINQNRYASKSLPQGGIESWNPVIWILKNPDFRRKGISYEFHPRLKRILMPELIGWPLRKEILLPCPQFSIKK